MQVPTTNEELAEHPLSYQADLLTGKVYLISGAGSGIGRACAWAAARLGATVVLAGRTLEKLNTVVEAIRGRGHDAYASSADIRDSGAVSALYEQIADERGRLDAVVNSAGGQFPKSALDISENGWQAVIDTNLNGTWRMMQGAAQYWSQSGTAGSIANVVVVQEGLYGVAHTRAARAGVVAVSQAVAVEWAELGIRVNCIAPGAIQTEGWAVYSQAAREKYPRTNPLMRAGSPWEIAEACIFLTGPTGEFINGEVLVVDGGGRHWGEIWTNNKPAYFARATRLWDDETDA